MRKRKVERDRLKKLWDEDLSSLQLRKSRRRAVVLITVICFAFSVISFRLIDLMVLNHETLSQRASKQSVSPHKDHQTAKRDHLGQKIERDGC